MWEVLFLPQGTQKISQKISAKFFGFVETGYYVAPPILNFHSRYVGSLRCCTRTDTEISFLQERERFIMRHPMIDYTRYLQSCRLCPRECSVDRTADALGYCRLGNDITVAHFGPHFGEEPPLTGTGGSGNIFFSSCNLRCIFCQNYQISHGKIGKTVTQEQLVEVFFSLRERGCHNINLVSPTPYIPLIACAIISAKLRGFDLPFVYNTNAYESVESLQLLDGLIDIYLPDFKYWVAGVAKRLSDVPLEKPYPDCAKTAILEMFRQVGHLNISEGIAKRGIIVRHLILPGGLAGSRHILDWIGDSLGTETCMSLMSQYFPLHDARRYGPISRRITDSEYASIVNYASDRGFENIFIQELESAPHYVPDFRRDEPFTTGKGSETL